MAVGKEGEIYEIDGRDFIVKNNQLVPIVGYENSKPQTDYGFAFKQDPTWQQTAGGVVANFLEGTHFGNAGEVADLGMRMMGEPEGQGVFDAVRSDFAERNPKTATGLEIGGNITTSMLLPLSRYFNPNLTYGQTMMRGVPVGMGFGGLEGYGKAEENKGMAGLMGMVLGAPLGAGGAGLGQFIGNRVVSPAFRAIAQRLDDSGISIEDALAKLKAINATNPGEGMIADIAPSLQQTGFAVASASPKAVNQATDVLEDRVQKQAPKLLSRMKKLLGVSKDKVIDIQSATAAMKAQAGPLYNQAHHELMTIDDELYPLLKKAGAGIYNQAKKIYMTDPDSPSDIIWPAFNQLEKGKTVPLAVVDYMKRALYRSSGSPEMQNVRKALSASYVDKLNRTSPAYNSARQMYADDFKMVDADKLGSNFLNMHPDDIASFFKSASNGEMQAFRAAALKSVEMAMDKASVGSDMSKKVIGKEILKKQLKQIFPDDAALDAFIETAETSGKFAVTRNEVLKGSQTAMRQGAQEQFQKTSLGGWIADMATGDVGAGFGKLVGTVKGPGRITDQKLAAKVANEIFKQGDAAEQVLINLERSMKTLTGRDKRIAARVVPLLRNSLATIPPSQGAEYIKEQY